MGVFLAKPRIVKNLKIKMKNYNSKFKIFKNSFWLSGSQVVGRIIGFLYFIFLARSLAVDDFGVLAWVLGFVYNFYPLADFGIERLVLKKVSRAPEKADFYLEKLLPLRLILAVFSVFVSLLLALFLGVFGEKLFLVFIFAVAVIPYNLLYLLAAAENAKENFRPYAFAVVLTSFLSAGIGLVFIKMGLGLKWVLFAYCLSNIVTLWWGIRQIGHIYPLPRSPFGHLGSVFDLSFWKEILKEAWVFALIFILAVFYLRIGLVLIGLVLGDYWAGIFGAAAKFFEAGILLPQSIALALFPISSKLFVEDKKKLGKVYLKGLAVLGTLGILGGTIMFFGGKFFIPLVYGQRYLPSVKIFSLSGILMALFCLNSLPGNIIQNSEKVKKFLPLAVANFLVAAAACFWLIRRIGVIGGVWGMVIGEVFGLVVNNWFVYKILNEQ